MRQEPWMFKKNPYQLQMDIISENNNLVFYSLSLPLSISLFLSHSQAHTQAYILLEEKISEWPKSGGGGGEKKKKKGNLIPGQPGSTIAHFQGLSTWHHLVNCYTQVSSSAFRFEEAISWQSMALLPYNQWVLQFSSNSWAIKIWHPCGKPDCVTQEFLKPLKRYKGCNPGK